MIGIKLVDSVKDLHYDQSINQWWWWWW